MAKKKLSKKELDNITFKLLLKEANKKPVKNAKPKKVKRAKSKPISKKIESTRSRKKPVLPDKKRAQTKAKKSIKSVSLPRANGKRKSVEPIARSNAKGKRSPKIQKFAKAKENKKFNTVSFISHGKPENVAKKFRENVNPKLIKKYLTKNRPVKGAPPKEPRGVVVIVTAKVEGEKKVFSKATDFDFVVNEENLKKFVADYLENASNEFEDIYGFENATISNYSLKFIY